MQQPKTYQILIRIMGPPWTQDVEYVTVNISARTEEEAYEIVCEGFGLGFETNEPSVISIHEIKNRIILW